MFTESSTGPVWGALFTLLMLTGCATDLRSRRIPNALVGVIVVAGLVYSLATRPLGAAMGSSLAGLVLGFAVWIVFYIVGVIGAGDVKFFAAAGTWLGPAATLRAALVTALVGGVLAVVFLLRERRLGSTMQRIALAASSRSVTVLEQAPGNAVSPRASLPYGVAMALGALIVAWWPGLVG